MSIYAVDNGKNLSKVNSHQHLSPTSSCCCQWNDLVEEDIATLGVIESQFLIANPKCIFEL